MTTTDADLRNSLTTLLGAIVRAALVLDPEIEAAARAEGLAAHRDLVSTKAKPDPQVERLDAFWVAAVDAAEADRAVRSEEDVNPTLQRRCPFALEELRKPSFDFDAAAQTVREISSSG